MKYAFGDFELNPATRELLRDGQPVALRPRSLECLVYLIEHRDRAVGRDELVAAVWGKVDVGDTVVAQTLLRARKALEDTGSQQGMIRTLPRFGYRWVAPVRELASPGDTADPMGADRAYGDGTEQALPPSGYSAHYGSALPGFDPDAGADAAEVVETVASDPSADREPVPEPGGWRDTGMVDAAETAAVDPPSPAERRRLPRIGWIAGFSLLVVLAITLLLRTHYSGRVQPTDAGDAVLVMPVTVAPVDSETAWVRLGAMDYMAARLHGSGVNVLPSEQALRLASTTSGGPGTVAREELLALSGARWIAMPELRRERDGWSIRLRVFGAGDERTLEARGQTALDAAAAAADAWLRLLGERTKAGPRPGPLAERLQRIDAEILAGRLTEARRLVRSSSPAERGDALFLLREGKLEFRAGNLDNAFQRFQDALEQSLASDMETRVGAILGLGSVERARNDPKAAESRYTQALALLESLPGDRVDARMMGIAYQGRGISRAQSGDLDAGAGDMGQARVWLQRSGDRITLGGIGHNLGKLEALRGDYLQALREFDRSIATFERFRVSDYLANSLREKAEVQLALARPAEAGATIGRADALLPKLEDDLLAAEVLLTKARIQIATGRLRDAEASLAASQARGTAEADPGLQELRLRLFLARGDAAQARLLAARDIGSGGADDRLRLTAVQAALRGRDLGLAKSWLAGVSTGPDPAAGESPALVAALAGAMVQRAAGDPRAALEQAERAAKLLGGRASPDREIQAGVLRALVLLDTRQHAAASAILGELEKYAESDYRVAWTMSRLYRSLGDARAAEAARTRAASLGGERDPAVEPVL